MKTYSKIQKQVFCRLVFLLCIAFQGTMFAQDCDFGSVTTQEWELEPAMTTVFLNSNNGFSKSYRFVIAQDRLYFRFSDMNVECTGHILCLITQNRYDSCALAYWPVESEGFYCTSGTVEINFDDFNEVGGYLGEIFFLKAPNDSTSLAASIDFAVMYETPVTNVDHNISVQDFDSQYQTEVFTGGLPPNENPDGEGAWYHFNSGSNEAIYIKYSVPIPQFGAYFDLYDENNIYVVPSDYVDFFPGECNITNRFYMVSPNTDYKVFVYNGPDDSPGYLNFSVHAPPDDSPNDRMVNATPIAPVPLETPNFTHGVIKRASHSPQITACTNYIYGDYFPFQEDIWYSFTATAPDYYFIIKNIIDFGGDIADLKVSILNEDGTETVDATCKVFTPMGSVEAISGIYGLTPGNTYLVRIGVWGIGTNCNPSDVAFDFCIAKPDPITNDECADATPFTAPLSGNSINLFGTTIAATPSANSVLCNHYSRKDAWWKFTATQPNYNFTFTNIASVTGYPNSMQLEMINACDGEVVLFGGCGTMDINQTLEVEALTIGHTYFLRLSGSLLEGIFNLSIAAPVNIPEDDFNSAAALTVQTACNFINISTGGATTSPENTCGFGNDDDVWYNFNATSQAIEFTIDNIIATEGSVYNIYFGIYEAGSTQLISCFSLNDLDDNQVVSELEIGQDYKLQMFAFGYENAANFDLCLQSIPGVANDECANAIPVTPSLYSAPNPAPIAVNTFGASSGTLDCNGFPTNDDVWYSFTANSSAYLFKLSNFMVNSGISGYPSVMLEFFESCGGASTGCYGLSENYPAVIAFTSGQTYLYRVWTEADNLTASFDLLQLELPPTPANDYCNLSVIVDVAAFDDPCDQVAGSTLGATNSNTFECGYDWWDDVYFSFTADYENIAVTLDNFEQLWGQSSGLHVLLYEDCLGSISYQCDEVSEGETLLYNGLNIGQTYYLKVFSAGCTECYTAFDLCLKEGGPPNDFPNFNYSFDMAPTLPLSGTTANAGFEMAIGLPCTTPGTPVQDVWYYLYNYGTINGIINMSNTSANVHTAIYKGNVLDPVAFDILASTCGTGDRIIALTGMESGQYYWLRVWTENGIGETFDLQFEDITATTAQIALPVPEGCVSASSVTVNNSNNYVGIPVMMGDDPVMMLYPYGNNLGTVTVDFYTTGTQRADNSNTPYLNRNISINVEHQPMQESYVGFSFLLTAGELAELGVSIELLNVTRDDNHLCSPIIAGTENTLLPQNYSSSMLDGYFINVNTDHFSSFYVHGGTEPLIGFGPCTPLTDHEAPVITCPDNAAANTDAGFCSAVLTLLAALATDNCGIHSIINDGLSSYPVGITTVMHTATDIHGNTTTCQQTVTVSASNEICNGVDDDCDGLTDNADPEDPFYCNCTNALMSATVAPSSTERMADMECSEGGWTHYFDEDGSNLYILLSIKKGGQSIGSIGDGTFAVRQKGSGGVTIIPNNYPVNYCNTLNWHVMNRYWEVEPTIQPTAGVNVRFYYTTNDFDALVLALANAIPPRTLTSHAQMLFYKVEDLLGNAYDINPVNGHTNIPIASGYGADGYYEYPHGQEANTNAWHHEVFNSDYHYGEYVVSKFSGGGGGGGNVGGAFPIELLYFTGYPAATTNILTWATATERNNRFQIIERSLNGTDDWVEIGRVTGASNSVTETNYQFPDENPPIEAYYHLRAVDFDGAEQISEVIYIERPSGVFSILNAFPVPVENDLNLWVNSPLSGEVTILLHDILGSVIYKNETTLPKGMSEITIDMRDLPSGTYQVTLENNSSRVMKIVNRIKT